MPRPYGFRFEGRGGEVTIFHHDRRAASLRGAAAEEFLAKIERGDDPQELMARATGNYKRGNERAGKNHPRNR